MGTSENKVLHIWSDEEKEYLKQITPGHHHREICEIVNQKFSLNLTVGQIKGAINRYKLNTGFTGQFSKGSIPPNKGKKKYWVGGEETQFKKGNKAYNWVPIGTERINKDGYIEIKVQDGKLQKNWRGKHIVIWEAANGPLPKGGAIIFGDSNNRNFDIDNLILVSRKQLLVLNRHKLIQNNADLTRTGVIIADLYSKISDRKVR